MKYLLIDTNSLANDILISDAENDILATLEFWTSNNLVQLLVPEIIIKQEWPKVSENLISSISKKYDDLLQTVKKSTSPLPTLIKHELNNIKIKAQRISKLLEKGLQYESGVFIKANIVDRQLKRLAPFHNKDRSTADGLIYFSTIAYLEQGNLNTFYFISGNTKDFTHPNDKNQIHPELINKQITNIFLTI